MRDCSEMPLHLSVIHLKPLNPNAHSPNPNGSLWNSCSDKEFWFLPAAMAVIPLLQGGGVLLTYMGGCQNYGPFWGTLNIRCRIIIGTQKGTMILTIPHMVVRHKGGPRYKPHNATVLIIGTPKPVPLMLGNPHIHLQLQIILRHLIFRVYQAGTLIFGNHPYPYPDPKSFTP